MLPIYSELMHPSLPRMTKVIHRAISIDCSFYVLIAAVGYFSEFGMTDPIVLKREVLTPGTTDYPVLIAVIANILSVTVAFPVNYNPFRNAFFSQVMKKDNYSQKENFVFTGLVLAFTCTISILFPNIKTVISLLGGLVAV